MTSRALAGLALATSVAVVVVALAVMNVRGPSFDMVRTLETLADDEGVWDNRWDQNQRKADALLARLKAETDPSKGIELRHEIALRHLVAGKVEAAIGELEQLRQDTSATATPAKREMLRADLALAYFRLGEVQNCLGSRHNASACILPIDPRAVHQKRLGASKAIELWAELLSDPATDPLAALGDRWLLNVAYMTLGEHPDRVPKQWLIPPRTFDSEYDIGRFVDVAAEKGLKKLGLSGGAILDDFDNDGHLDAMVSSQGVRDPLDYFRNDGDGSFTRRTEEAGLTGLTGGLYMVQADYDNDGSMDVFIPRGAWLHDHGKFPNSLLRNNGDGTFTDVTSQAGVLSFYPTQTATWADFNNDGCLDLFVGNEIVRSKPADADPLASNQAAGTPWPEGTPAFELYLNHCDGRFEEVGARSGIALQGMIKGANWGDYDNDGWMDLYVSVRGAQNHLFRNLGATSDAMPRFQDVTQKAGVAQPIMSFPTWFWDYNNDGWEDIMVLANSSDLPNQVLDYLERGDEAKGERPRLYRNNGNGTFTDVAREVGLDRVMLAMGSNFGDVDNDGWLDFYVGTGSPPLNMLVPNRMFRNAGGKVFQDVTTSGGFGILQKGHAVAFGDTDGDGDQDILENIGGAYESDQFWSVLYQNPGHRNHWVKLMLSGVKANRAAVGARIHLRAKMKDGSTRDIYRTVSSGSSFGANTLQPQIGLSNAVSIESLQIRWPGSGRVQEFKGPIAVDATYSIREIEDVLKVVRPR